MRIVLFRRTGKLQCKGASIEIITCDPFLALTMLVFRNTNLFFFVFLAGLYSVIRRLFIRLHIKLIWFRHAGFVEPKSKPWLDQT